MLQDSTIDRRCDARARDDPLEAFASTRTDETRHDVTLDSSTYNLSFVNSVASNAYVYFGYHTTRNSFVPASVSRSEGNYSGILAGTNLSNGFFFDPLVGQSDPAGTGADGELGNYVNGSLSVQTATGYSIMSVPEPASWALFAVGIGLLGFAVRARRKGVSSISAA